MTPNIYEQIVNIIIINVNLIITLVLIFAPNKNKTKSVLYFIIGIIFLLIWKITLSMYYSDVYEKDLLTVGRINYASIIFTLYFFLLFSSSFLRKNISGRKTNIFFIFYSIFTFSLFILTTFSEFIVKNELVDQFSKERKTEFGTLFFFYLLFVIFSIAIFCLNLFKSYKLSNNKQEKTSLLIISVGFITSGIIASITNLILPFIFNLFMFQTLGPIGTLGITISVTLAILKYNLFNIKILIGKFVYYILAGILVYLGFYISLLLNIYLFGSPFEPQSFVFGIFLAIIFLFVFNFYNKILLNKITIKIISPDFNPNEELVNFNNQVSTILEIEELKNIIKTILLKTIRPKFINIIDYNKTEFLDNQIYKHINVIYGARRELIIYTYIEDKEENTKNFKEELTNIKLYMINNKISVLTAIGDSKKILFILEIGEKKQSNFYNVIETEFINSVLKIFSLAITRAKLYQEVQNFNKELKEKINKATLQLKQKNRKLKELIKFQKDIMDIMGHELRTPLGITRNALLSLNLARQKATDNKVDISQFESMMDIAIRNIEREIDLVETILTSAKIDNAKLVLNTKKVNLIKILEEVYQSHQEAAEKKKLWIKKEFTEPEISIEGDEIRLYQVFNNLVSNAVKYTNQGGLTIKAYKHRENAIVEIIDTGEGIPKESIEKLGKKFYRVNNYINKSQNTETIQNLVVRPGGTGLGLYVTFELTRLMKGEIKVKSKLGEGSNFTVIFPLVKSGQKTS